VCNLIASLLIFKLSAINVETEVRAVLNENLKELCTISGVNMLKGCFFKVKSV